MGMPGSGNAEQIPDFPLIPVSIGEHRGHGGQVQVATGQRHLDDQVFIAIHRQQMIEDSKIRGRQPVPVCTKPFVHGREIVEHGKRRRRCLQVAQYLHHPLTPHPQHRHPGQGGLNVLDVLPESVQQPEGAINAGLGQCVGIESVCGHDAG